MEYEEPKQVAPEPEPEPAPEVPVFKEEEPFYKPCGKPCIMAPKPIPVPIPEPIEPIEVCCSCLSVYDVDENAPEPLCPVCKKAARVRSKLSKSRLDLKPCESTQNKKRLEDLTTHIDEVINLTKRYKMEGIISPSIEKFIQTCNNTKEKIEDYANIASTCASHQNPPHMSRPASATGSQRSVKSNVPDRPTEVPTCREPTCGIRATISKQVSAAGSQKSVRSDAPDKPPEVPGSKAPLSSASEPAIDPEELGYFESKYKEVIKVTRLQNEDGTITEERQVITVKTESKNLRKPDALERTYGDEKFVGSCTCQNYNIRHISKNNVHTTESYNSECIGHRGDEGLKDKPSGIKCARETTSEHTPRCPAMVEPKLRACISAGPERSMGGDVCKTCISIVSSKEIPLRTDSDSKKSVQCSKVSVATSTDSGICCLRKTPSVCSQKLRPHTSKASIGPEKQTDTAQKKVTLDKSTYCMPNCCDGKYNTISCGAMWRDACTSTTDIKISDSCTSKTSAGNNRKKSKKNKYKSNSRCKIKIIIKPPSENDDKTKCKDDAFSVTNSVIDVLNKIIPCNQGNEGKPKRSAIEELCIKCLEKLKDKPSSCTVCREPPEDALEMAGPCHNCLVKMNDKTNSEKCINCQKKLEKALRTNDLCERCVAGLSSALGQDPSDKICSSCKACKEKIEALAKDSLCGSCLAKLSAKSPCRTPTKLTPKPSEVKSVEEVEKEIDCPLLAASSVPSNYCTSVATDTRTCSCNNTPSRNYVAVPTKYSRRCLRRLMNDGSKVSMRSACCGPCSEQRDAATVTKRSNRFDVRPIRRRHTCDFSEPRSRARQPKKSHSFHEKDYNYFKKPRQ